MYKDIIIQLPKTSEFKKLVESFEFELKKEGKDESFVKEAKRYLCELFNWSEAIGIKTISMLIHILVI